jgi:RNA polymerase sigma-70 factor (ECF subfamily)
MTPEQEQELGRLMGKAQTGDRAAYEALLRQLAGAVRGLARRRLPADSVDDGIQNVLLAVHRARHTYDSSRPFAPWFWALAGHCLTDTWRRVHRRARHEVQRTDPGDLAGLVPEASSADERAAVRAAVAGLPERQRRVIELLKLEQLTAKEVAQVLGMSESAVKVTAHRAYKKLRRALGEWDV